jgi:PAS domain S-box-containing protein
MRNGVDRQEMKILVADDNETNRKLLRVLLEAENHEVVEAADGAEALQMLEKEQIDAIISDILMPKMDGYRLCSKIRSVKKYDSIPFLFHTNTYLSPSDEKLAFELGADAFLKKPSSVEVILEEIRRIKSSESIHPRSVQLSPEPHTTKQYNEVLIHKLEKKNVEFEQAKEKLADQFRLSTFSADVGLALTLERSLQSILQSCCEAIVTHLSAAFARIWTLNAEENVLELQASAGMYTHLDGPHGRVPVGKFKIGLIAEERKPHLTNDVIGDPRVGDQEWAKRERMVAFAGYPLIIGNQLVGVMAMFAKTPLDELTLKAMDTVANHIALGIRRHWADIALRESEERYRIIAENATDAIVTIDEESTILFANKASTKVFGYSSTELIGQSITMLMPHHLRKVHRSAIQRYLKTGQKHLNWESIELPGLHKSGKEFALEISFGEYVKNGKHVFTGILRDISERKHAEEERQILEKQLLQAQKIEAIGQLAGGVAHDFNNTLMSIGGYTELLIMKLPETDPLQRIAIEIQKGVSQGADLTKQLLAFSRKQVLSPTIMDLNQSIAKVEDMVRRLIGEDLQLCLSLLPDLGFMKVDPGQVHQVIINLIINARDAMPQGGKVTIETTNVQLDEEYVRTHPDVTAGQYIELGVSDTGVGMDDATVSRIFEPFFTTKEEGKGTGLGLSTVFGIVKQSDGHISVYSEPGHGTTFKLYFPRVDEPLANEAAVPASSQLLGKGEMILLVDDNQSIRTAVGALLEMKGYDVLQAENGRKALEIARSRAEPIHLLITDVVMPEMGGMDLAHRLANVHSETKVLYMSGYTQEAINRQGHLHPGAGFLSKPATIDSLLQKIREVLG